MPSFGLDYLVWGISPAGYHLTSVLLDAANAALFYVLSTLFCLASAAAFLRFARAKPGRKCYAA